MNQPTNGMHPQEYRATYKKPGMTLAESQGLDIPGDCPSRPLPVPHSASESSGSEAARRHQEIRDEGCYDLDAYGRRDHQ